MSAIGVLDAFAYSYMNEFTLFKKNFPKKQQNARTEMGNCVSKLSLAFKSFLQIPNIKHVMKKIQITPRNGRHIRSIMQKRKPFLTVLGMYNFLD